MRLAMAMARTNSIPAPGMVYIPYSQFVRVILHYDKTRCGRDDISKEENDLTPEEEARLKELHEAIHEKINQGD